MFYGFRSLAGAIEHGFTLIELLIVLNVVGVLLVLAVPSYLSFRVRSADAVAKANIRGAVHAAEMFAIDNTGAKGDADNKKATTGYKGMTADLLRTGYNPGLASVNIVPGKTTVTAYCISAAQNGRAWSALGPGITTASFKNNDKCK